MDTANEIQKSADYHIGNTKYTVTPFFGDASEKENIEDKIKRLILQDKKQKGARL